MVDINKYILLLSAYEHYSPRNLSTEHDYHRWTFSLLSRDLASAARHNIAWLVAWMVDAFAGSYAICSSKETFGDDYNYTFWVKYWFGSGVGR